MRPRAADKIETECEDRRPAREAPGLEAGGGEGLMNLRPWLSGHQMKRQQARRSPPAMRRPLASCA
jgi:hypothetical protein